MNGKPLDAERVNPGTLWQRRDAGGNIGKEMIQPGKTSGDLLMRTYLKDDNEVVLITLFKDYLREWGIEEDDPLISDFLAAKASLKGLGRHQYTEISTGIMDEEHRERGLFRRGNNRGKDKNRDENP